MTWAIQTVGLSKGFNLSQGYRDLLPWKKRSTVQALEDVNLQIPQGEIFGILGPNGAGKTTLFKILGALILPTSGQVWVKGWDVTEEPGKVKRVLTYVVSEERSLHWRLTGRQNLRYFAALNNLSRREAGSSIEELLSLLGLRDAADRRVMYYSTGMRQKLALARGLLTDPDILLLDEPTRSLDPLMARGLWRFIREELVGQLGKTVVLSTHNLDEARTVCHRVAVLNRGRVCACGSISELTAQVLGHSRYSVTLLPPADGVSQKVRDVPGVLNVTLHPAKNGDALDLEVSVTQPEVQIPQVLDRLIAANSKVLACTPREQTLSDVLEFSAGEESG